MDKIAEKKLQHAGWCNLLVTEGYDVMLLTIMLGVLRHFQNLDHATKEMKVPDARKGNLYSKLFLHSVHTLQNLVHVSHGQQRHLERRKPTSEARGRVRGR